MVNLCATIIIIYVYLISSEDQFSKSYPKKLLDILWSLISRFLEFFHSAN